MNPARTRQRKRDLLEELAYYQTFNQQLASADLRAARTNVAFGAEGANILTKSEYAPPG